MSIFQKIIRGEIPSHKVYEDAAVFAFLDINPVSRGHVLVVPREPAATIGELSEEAAAGLGRSAAADLPGGAEDDGVRGVQTCCRTTGKSPARVVMHAHVHVIPRYDDGSGLEVEWRAGKLDAAAGAELARADGGGRWREKVRVTSNEVGIELHSSLFMPS